MKDIPLRSYVYFALCELCDASDNLDEIISRLDDSEDKANVIVVSKYVESAIEKLQSLQL